MNQFRKREDGTLVTEDYIRANFDGGLPAVLDTATLVALGYDPIFQSPQPLVGFGQYVTQDGVEQDGEGNWMYKWVLQDSDPAVVAAQRVAAQKVVSDAIKAERDMRKAGGVKLNIGGTDYWFWTDDPSRNQYAMLDSKIRRNNIPAGYKLDDWKTMSGDYVPFTVAILYQVIDAGIDKESQLFTIAKNHQANMLLADNPYSYNWQTGWPQTYAERERQLEDEANAAPPVEEV